MAKPDYASVREYVARRLREELAPDLYYHAPSHTLDDVLPAAERLAKTEGIQGEDLLLLRTAAVLHDIGYIFQYAQNESIGVQVAGEVLPGFGYTSGQIERIGELIMATKMPQQPRGLLQQIICDADMDSLGRADFHIVSHKLRLEMAAYLQPMSVRDWYYFQIKFLEQHHYFTASARGLRDRGKAQHVRDIKELLGLNER